MMFLPHGPTLLAISQPTHALVAGQLLRAWRAPLGAALLLAAEQHDLAWLDWELDPAFDATTGLPKLFLNVGAAEHAPLWTRAVDQAAAAWGRHAALLISRHGSVIYTRFTRRHQASEGDRAAASAYLARQAPRQAAWAAALTLDAAALERESGLIALADTLSLGLCGGLALPLEVEGPGADGGVARYRMERADGRDEACTLSPWPFRDDAVTLDVDAAPITGGRFGDEGEMRAWITAGTRVRLRLRMVRPDPDAATRSPGHAIAADEVRPAARPGAPG